MKNFRPILLVDDDDIDAMSVRRAFKEINITNPLARSVNGEEALKYLYDRSNELPCLILLDMNMPKMNGLEFLHVVKEEDRLKHIPVIVLTTSAEQCDIKESFKYSVGGYIVKPVDYKSFVEAIRTINMYWTLSELPSPEARLIDAECEINSIS